MQPFDHYTPTTLPEALDLLVQLNGQARVIAGGSDLLLKMRAGELTPSALVNIKRLPELKGIAYDPQNGLRLGALTTLRELTRAPQVQELYPFLARTAALMASEQIRCFATLGGNLCNAAPSADLAPPLLALSATAVLVGPSGVRQMPLEDFFKGPGQTALQDGELLQEVRLPPPSGTTVYVKHAQRAFMDIALVGVAVRLEMDGEVCRRARIALGAVAPVPMRARQAEQALEGAPLTPDRIQATAQAAAGECAPIDDVRCSAAYRRTMVEVLTRRILAKMGSVL